jgi:hypothetical protein
MTETTPKLKACPFCQHENVKMLVDRDEWEMARVSCPAHRCGALGPWVELSNHETVAEARNEAARLWNDRASS